MLPLLVLGMLSGIFAFVMLGLWIQDTINDQPYDKWSGAIIFGAISFGFFFPVYILYKKWNHQLKVLELPS